MSDDESQSDTEKPEKKRVGRPRKVVPKKKVPKEGIVQIPLNKHLELTMPTLVNIVELIYDNPIMWKKIFHLFKTMSVESVRLLFHPTGVKLFAVDHLKKSRIYVSVFGDKMNRYYCAEPLEIGFTPTNINKVLQTLTKDHGQIIFSTSQQYKRSKLWIIIMDDSMGSELENEFEIDKIDSYDWQVEEELEREEYYPIHFVLSAKKLKKKVSDSNTLGDIIRIEKESLEPLRIGFTFNDKRGRQYEKFNDSGLINLISLVEADDFFSTSVYLEYIKPFSSALIADEIHVSADKESDIIFTAYLDQEERNYAGSQKKYKVYGTEKCVIKVITEIVKSVR